MTTDHTRWGERPRSRRAESRPEHSGTRGEGTNAARQPGLSAEGPVQGDAGERLSVSCAWVCV